MEISALEQVCMDESVRVPSDLFAEAEALVDSLDLSERLLEDEAVEAAAGAEASDMAAGGEAAGTMVPESGVRNIFSRGWVRAFSAAAAVALLVGIGFSLNPRDAELVDTYDDPMLAYAELERAMLKIGGGLQAGLAGVQKSNDCIEMPVAILNNSINR